MAYANSILTRLAFWAISLDLQANHSTETKCNCASYPLGILLRLAAILLPSPGCLLEEQDTGQRRIKVVPQLPAQLHAMCIWDGTSDS